MESKFLITPFFLGEPEIELKRVSRGRNWRINNLRSPEGTAENLIIELYRNLADFVAETMASGFFPVSISGDCLSAIGVLAGLEQAGISATLIWFDAHGDFHTWETTLSGHLGGMPLAMIAGVGDQRITAGIGLTGFGKDRILLVGARDLELPERKSLQDNSIEHYPDIPSPLILPPGPIYVHFDTDVINPEEAPAMRYPAPGGPSPADIEETFRILQASGQLVAVSVSAWSPTIDQGRMTEAVCMELLDSLLPVTS